MVSPRAATASRTGNETSPKVRCPFQTLLAMCQSSPAQRQGVKFDCSITYIIKARTFPHLYVVNGVQAKTELRENPRAAAGTRANQPRKDEVLRPAASRVALALRLSYGGGWNPQVLGRPQGAYTRPGRKAFRRNGGRSSAGLRKLRGQHPCRKLRRGKRHAFGPWQLRSPGRRTRRRQANRS